MVSKRAWVGYTVIRVLAFLIPFAIVMLTLPAWSYNWIVGLIAGTIIGAAVSYIFLRRQRMQMGDDLAEMRNRRDQRTKLDREEDDALEGAGPADEEDEADNTAPASAHTSTEDSSDKTRPDTDSEAEADDDRER